LSLVVVLSSSIWLTPSTVNNMPELTWPSKSPPQLIADAALEMDTIIFPRGAGYPGDIPEDQLILGDNLAVMSALLPDYEGKIDLIYADPPFFTNRRYSARVGRGEDSRRPEGWRLAEGYPDHWPDIESYLDMLYPRLCMMHRLLAPTGTLYLHLDWHANHYARLLLDEIFKAGSLINEVVWIYHGPSPIRSAFNRKHDTILAYAKSDQYTFNADAVREPYNPNTVKTFGSSPKAGFGKIPDLDRGKIPEDWWYFPVIARLHNERTGYPTQKPKAILERIVLASSNQGDLVADFFCGAGTTALVSAQSGRRFISNDVSWRAIHTTRSRLIHTMSRPFALLRETHTPIHRISGKPDSVNKQAGLVSLDEDLLPDLDYWEIDPEWNGVVFKSAAQAVRPRGTKPIASRLEIPVSTRLCDSTIRLVNINGEQIQIEQGISS
jgi:site-specific DNA-methyltransferase (adenine-specific)